MNITKIVFITFSIALAGCGARRAEVPESSISPEEGEYIASGFLFGSDGCLTDDMKRGYADEIPCLDQDKDGCVTWVEWGDFMGYWKTRAPEAGQSLCSQMKEKK